MALYHFHVTQIKRSVGQSAVACAAYRAGEKLYSEYYGEVSDYTNKGGVVYSDILLPPQAPCRVPEPRHSLERRGENGAEQKGPACI